jgi:hypothetical protein
MANGPASNRKRAIVYTVDLDPGVHRYVAVEGVGECRDNFRRMLEALERGDAEMVVAAKAEYFFVDTSPMWIEKLIATVQRRGVLVADAERNWQYNLREPADEVAFRNLQGK